MTIDKSNRIKFFKIATVVSGRGVAWLAEQNNCSIQHIYQVLKSRTRSARIEQQIDNFIYEALAVLKIQLKQYDN